MQVSGSTPTITLGGGNGSITAGSITGPGLTGEASALGFFDLLLGALGGESQAVPVLGQSQAASLTGDAKDQPHTRKAALPLVVVVDTSADASIEEPALIDAENSALIEAEIPPEPSPAANTSENLGTETIVPDHEESALPAEEIQLQDPALAEDALAIPAALQAAASTAQVKAAAPAPQSQAAAGSAVQITAEKPATRTKAPVAAAPKAPSEMTPQRVWNIRELAVGVDQAINNLAPGAEEAFGMHAPLGQDPASKFGVKSSFPLPSQPAAAPAPRGQVNGAPPSAEAALANPTTATPLPASGDALATQPAPVVVAASAAPAVPVASLEPTAPAPAQPIEGLEQIFESGQITRSEWDAATMPVLTDAPDEVSAPPFSEQLREAARFLATQTEGIIRMGDKGVEAQLKLNPPELGGVQVNLTVGSDLSVRAEFIAERGETVALIRNNIDQFRQVMGQQGLVVDRVQVSISGPSAGSAGPQADSGGNSHAFHQDSRFEGRSGDRRNNDPSRGNPQRDPREEQE